MIKFWRRSGRNPGFWITLKFSLTLCSMGPKFLFLNISLNYWPKLIKLDSGVDNAVLYQMTKTDPDLIQKADFVGIYIKNLWWERIYQGNCCAWRRSALSECFSSYLRQGGYVITGVGLSVCLFVCLSVFKITQKVMDGI